MKFISKYKYFIAALIAAVLMLMYTVSNAQISKTWLIGQTGQLRYDSNRVRVSDTAAMLTPYLRKIDTGTHVISVTASSPLSATAGVFADISIANSKADGSTKGAASFTAADFDASSGLISIDYTNGQAASGSGAKGFLTSTDWNTFNNKVSLDSATFRRLYTANDLSATPQVIKDRSGNSASLAISTANIGINTTTPVSKLEIMANAASATIDSTSGISLTNTTAATLGNQRISPVVRILTEGWGTTGSASIRGGYQFSVLPVQGATPTYNLVFQSLIAGVATTRLTLESGQMTHVGHITVNGSSMYAAAFRSYLASDDNVNYSSTGPQVSIANSASKYFSVTKVGTGEVFRADVKGVLLVTMSTATRDAISSPATGALVNNSTTTTTDQYDGTGWRQLEKVLTGSATLDFGSTNSGRSSDLTITVTGAADGDAVSLGVPSASLLNNSCYTVFVSAANTVTVRYNNYSSGAQDPASGTFKVTVSKN